MLDSKNLKIYAKKFLKYVLSKNIDFETSLKPGILEIIEIFENKAENQKSFLIADFLKSENVKFSKKIALIKEICSEEHFLNFLKIINKLGNFGELDKILGAIIDEYNFSKKLIQANVFSAIKLNDEQIKKIQDLILRQTGFMAQIKNQIQKEIIGGFVIKIDSLILDLSVKTILKNISQKLFG